MIENRSDRFGGYISFPCDSSAGELPPSLEFAEILGGQLMALLFYPDPDRCQVLAYRMGRALIVNHPQFELFKVVENVGIL